MLTLSENYIKKYWKNFSEIWQGYNSIYKNWKLDICDFDYQRQKFIKCMDNFIPNNFIYLDDIFASGSTLYFIIKRIIQEYNNWILFDNKKITNLFSFTFSKTLNGEIVDYEILNQELSDKINKK